jgi:outer membrane lipoprotein-sorting protein
MKLRRRDAETPRIMLPRKMKPLRLCVSAALLACTHAQLVAGPVPEPQVLYAQVLEAHRVPETMSCDAKAFVEAPQNGGRYALHISVKRPRSLRIEALTPMGDPAAVLVADQGRFALLDLRNNVFYRGPATPENLSRLIPVPLTPDQLVAFLTGTVPQAEPTASRRAGDGYLLSFGGEEVTLGADLRLAHVSQKPLWELSLDDDDDSSGAQVPRHLHLEARDTKVDLHTRNNDFGRAPPPQAFRLEPPAGMRVEDVQ